jgi:hypothetical protein
MIAAAETADLSPGPIEPSQTFNLPPDAPRPRGTVDGLLTDLGGLVQRTLAADPAVQSATVRAMLVAILVGTAAFGAAVGFTRGGVQILFAAIKLPLVVLLTAAVCTPALTGLSAALGRPASLRQDLIRVLATLGRGSLVLAALAPVMLIATCVRLGYHQSVMLLVACCLVAGGASLPSLAGALWAERRGRLFLIAAMLVTVVLGGTQIAWLFRPYVVRPQTVSVPFLRALDSNFGDSLETTQRSARGIYRSGRGGL